MLNRGKRASAIKDKLRIMALSSLFFLSLPYVKATCVAMSCEEAWPVPVPLH